MAGKKMVIGSLLQKARRKQKIKISRAVEDLRIPKKYLYAFENNDLTPFPSPAYAVGFLKNYAEYLGLDSAPLVDGLKEHIGYEPLDDSLMHPPKVPGRSWLPMATLGVLMILLLIGAYFAWKYFIDKDHDVATTEEMPAHLAAFLVPENKTASATSVANDINSYFNTMAETAQTQVRVLATTDVRVVIRDRLGNILQQGLLSTGDAINLPQGEGLKVHAADLNALGFYVGSFKAKAASSLSPENTGFYLVSLDNLEPSLDKAAPAS